MAMCNHPAVLIADEPTTALDATVQQEIIQLMHYLQQEHHTAMIFITHDLTLASTIADEVMVMYKGEMMEYGPTDSLLSNPKNPYTKALLSCRPSPEHKGHPLPIVSDFPDGGEYTAYKQDYTQTMPPSPPEQLLAVNNLRVWFPGKMHFTGKVANYFKAVDDVSFTINKGEVLGLVGESGCGKSTVSKALAGLLPATSGDILYDNKNLSGLSPREWRKIRKDIQMIFQDPYSSLNPRMTIGDIIMEPMLVHEIVPKSELNKEAARMLGMVQLPAGSFNRYPHEFSGGQRQRIGIARALSLRPKLIICDESVSALDVSVQAQILNLLKELQREFGLTYLFISHDLSVVHYFSDRVMVMQAGKIVESGKAEQVLKNPENEYTKRLITAAKLKVKSVISST